MRLCIITLALLALVACTVVAQADAEKASERESSNSANNPVEPKFTLQYWNYVAPSLNNVDGAAENALGRILIPFKIGDVQQVMHVVAPIVPTRPRKAGRALGLATYNSSPLHAAAPSRAQPGRSGTLPCSHRRTGPARWPPLCTRSTMRRCCHAPG